MTPERPTRGDSTTAWLIAIFFGFPFAPLIMLVGSSSPSQRQRIGTRYIIWGTVIGWGALFAILVPIAVLTGEPALTTSYERPTVPPYAHLPATPAYTPTPKISEDEQCLQDASCAADNTDWKVDGFPK